MSNACMHACTRSWGVCCPTKLLPFDWSSPWETTGAEANISAHITVESTKEMQSMEKLSGTSLSVLLHSTFTLTGTLQAHPSFHLKKISSLNPRCVHTNDSQRIWICGLMHHGLKMKCTVWPCISFRRVQIILQLWNGVWVDIFFLSSSLSATRRNVSNHSSDTPIDSAKTAKTDWSS